jgi:hypothetical protein
MHGPIQSRETVPLNAKLMISTWEDSEKDELIEAAEAQVQKDQQTSQPNQHIAAIITEVIYKDDELIEATKGPGSEGPVGRPAQPAYSCIFKQIPGISLQRKHSRQTQQNRPHPYLRQ